jgi:signal transduction histidine kinase
VDTQALVREIAASLAERIAAAGVTLRIDPLPELRVPATLLAQVFDNLIANALRYGSRPGGTIEIGGESRGNMVRLHVRDHGPGIPEKERNRVFDVFFRGTSGKEVEGTGVGLATVSKVARLYGGRAWVEETPGGGATFVVEMSTIPEEP